MSHLTSTKLCPYILEGHLSTKPILSAPHLQGPISNIYVHFRLVDKQLRAWPHHMVLGRDCVRIFGVLQLTAGLCA